MKKGFLIGTVALLLMLGGKADAAPADFRRCDGFGSPLEMSERRAERRGYLGIAPPVEGSRLGELPRGLGLRACAIALEDAALRDGYWLRRIMLMHGQAFHHISADAFENAIALLDQTVSLVRPDNEVLYDRSLGVASRALRAIALADMERDEASGSLLAEIERTRPYSASIANLTFAIRMRAGMDRAIRLRWLRRMAMLDPHRIRGLFGDAMISGDYAQAVAYARQVSFNLPRQRRGWTIEGFDETRAEQIVMRANYRGTVAYALLALDRNDEALREIADARDELSAAGPELAQEALNAEERRAFQRMRTAAREGHDHLDRWESAMQLRRDIPGMPVEEAFATIQRQMEEFAIVVPDLLEQIPVANAADDIALREVSGRIRGEIMAGFLDAERTSLSDIGRMLPIPEFSDAMPRMRREGGNLFRTNLEGYWIGPDEALDLINVRFGSVDASFALIEEAALLAAAEYVLAEGYDSFVIETTQRIERTTQTVEWARVVSTNNSGFEIRLLIRPVDRASLPAMLEEAQWRLISADDVVASLQPVLTRNR